MDAQSTKNPLEGFIFFDDKETPKMKEIARKELGETEELKEKCLQQMKALIRDNWNTSICTDEEMAMVVTVVVNYGAEKESSQVSGIHVLCETGHIQLSLIPYLLRYAYYGKILFFNSLPQRYKGLHAFNDNVILRSILLVLDRFFPKKIKERIILHGMSRDAFLQQFPPCIIPTDFGGTLGPLNNDHLIDIMLGYLQKMKDDQRYFLQQNHCQED